MKTVKVTWSDGDTTITDINGTMEEIRAYYVGKWFNLGGIYNPCEDRMVQGMTVEELV